MSIMASSLIECPVDILQLIFPLLARADLASLCLTTRHFLPLVEPLLYSTLDWILDTTYSAAGSTTIRPIPIIAFLQTIIHRPELAKFVHRVVVRGRTVPFQYRPVIPVVSTDLSPLIRLGEITGLTTQGASSSWTLHLLQGRTDAFLALLLCQLPHIRHLTLGEAVSEFSGHVTQIFDWALDPAGDKLAAPCGNFPHLTTVEYGYLEGPRTSALEWIPRGGAPFFHLPNAHHISAVWQPDIDGGPILHIGAHSPVARNLTSLHLELVH